MDGTKNSVENLVWTISFECFQLCLMELVLANFSFYSEESPNDEVKDNHFFVPFK